MSIMRAFHLFFGFYLLLVSLLGEADEAGAASGSNKVYIVYMGASRDPDGGPRSDHTQLLSMLKKRGVNTIVETYSKGFSGFAAHLSDEDAKTIAQRPGVVSVFPDSVLQLLTTRSWDFLRDQAGGRIDSPSVSAPSGGADTIIGIIDTGIWPESASFIDDDMGPIPSHWKGICMAGNNFTSSKCNRKLIGARYYESSTSGTPRDEMGHGTHVASTAAGRPVPGASFYGLANGTASGGSPGSRIAIYSACTPRGCGGSAILKAFDDAIADGVDVLSLSLGMPPGTPKFDTDPISIGAFHATEKGIIVVCAAGNSGPYSASVVNVAPWILSVAATTLDRDVVSNIVLGGDKVIKGGGINFSNLSKSPVYPLVDGHRAQNDSYGVFDGRDCFPGRLDVGKVKGKVVLCENTNIMYNTEQKFFMMQLQGAVGMIVIDDRERQVPSKYGTSPIASVSKEDGDRILSYINSTSNPLVTILPTETILSDEPAPVVAVFSSRGPTYGVLNLLNPDVAAPGVAILAAWPSNGIRDIMPNKDPPIFEIVSGTSMACPHVSGLAATVKSQHPTWSPSAIKSSIMTTAIQTNNLHAPITTVTGSRATPFDIGAGEINLLGAMQPGLVYETETADYIQFLCDMGYNATTIKIIALGVPTDFSCPSNSNSDLISDMNYPSIAISGLKENESRTVNRTVTNLGEQVSTYTATVEAPASLHVKVVPKKLQFTKKVKKLSFQVMFEPTATPKEDLFGSITWSNEKYKVRSPFVVNREYK